MLYYYLNITDNSYFILTFIIHTKRDKQKKKIYRLDEIFIITFFKIHLVVTQEKYKNTPCIRFLRNITQYYYINKSRDELVS